MNYKIILDKNELTRFIDWLPELKRNETFYCALFARAKYYPEFPIKSGETTLRRFTADKDYLYDKIKQLECEVGSYKLKGIEIPQQSLVLFINPNPRNLDKAAAEFLLKFTERFVRQRHSEVNPLSELLSEIQTACVSKKPFVHFDFDNVTMEEMMSNLDGVINPEAINLIRTKGGYHLLVRANSIAKELEKTWYKKVCKLAGLDSKAMKDDSLMPVPGCTQGGYIPSLITNIQHTVHT